MKYKSLAALSLSSFMLMTFLVNINHVRELKPGDYIKEEDAYFVQKIESEADLVKAHKFITPTDNKYSTQKNYSHGTNMLGDLEGTWSSYTGAGTTVAIIDDGFDYNHPEYTRSDGTSAILNTSRYYYSDDTNAYYKSYSSDPTCIAEDWEQGYSGYEWATHGTCTSTTAAAPMNNGGGVGIAPDANILALKIDFSFVAIKAAIQYAISQGVDVINMSLGAYSENFTDGWGDAQEGSSGVATYLNSVCQQAYNAGIIVVAAAGNESTWHKSYPACNTKVIGVGALEENDGETLAAFTNYVSSSQTGEINVDILAPGYVYTAHQKGTKTSIQHTYGDTQGTSFSSPIVAGAACLWKQKYPNGTPDQFLSQLQSTASDIGAYKNKMIPVHLWGSYSDVGPSNIECGRLNVGQLLDIGEPFVTVKQSSVNIVTGETKQIELDTYNGSISYSMANTNVATVSSSGLVTGVAAGSTTLTVTATKDSHTASVDIPVIVTSPVACTSLAINPTSVSIEAGKTYEIEPTITVTPSNASRSFMFASNDESVATVDFESGLLTGVAAGSTTIDIECLYGSGSATLNVTVTAPTTPTSWSKITSDSQIINGDYLIVYEDGSKAFNGGLDTLDAVNNYINVTISNNKIAYSASTEAAKFTINSLSSGYSILAANGKYIGRSANSNGMDTSTSALTNYISISSGNASIVGEGGKTICCNTATDQNRFRYITSGGDVQLYKAETGGSTPSTVSVTGVSVSPTNLNLQVGGSSSTLTATITPSNATNKTVTWTSSNTGVATVSNGTVTPVGAGSTTITVTTADGGFTATCSVTVTNPTVAVTGVTLSPTVLNLQVGGSQTLTATVTPSNATNKNVTWSSNNTNVATVNNGTVTAVATGNATITVTTVDGGKTATCAVTVTSSGELIPGEEHTVTYASSTASSATTSGTAPTGSSIIFNNTYNSKEQITKNNSQTWTIKGYTNYIITSLKAELHRNSSSGAGTLSIKNNGSSISTDYSSLTTSNITSSYSQYELLDDSFLCGGDIVITVSCSTNSVYCDKIIITYAEANSADKIVDSLSASYSGSDIFVGGSLDESKVSVTASYTDSTTYPDATLKSSDYQLSGFTSETAGQKTVTVTYTGSLQTSVTPLTTTFNVQVINDSITGVTISLSKTAFHPGETISKSMITLNATWASGNVTHPTDFSFANDGYMFTYEDAPSGGSSATKQFSVSFNNSTYNFSVNVSRTAYVAPSSSALNITGDHAATAGVTGTQASGAANYNDLVINGVTCSLTNAYVYTKSNVKYISFGTAIGDIYNTVALNKRISSLSITKASNSRNDEKLYVSQDGSNWVLLANANLESTAYFYFKIAYETTSSSYSNFNISLGLSNYDSAVNVSNYIMYEDTNNQCLTKLDTAIVYFNNLSSSEKETFRTSTDYVIATARARLEAWAASQGQSISYNPDGTIGLNSSYENYDSNSDTMIIVIVSIISISSVSSLFFIIRKKRLTK